MKRLSLFFSLVGAAPLLLALSPLACSAGAASSIGSGGPSSGDPPTDPPPLPEDDLDMIDGPTVPDGTRGPNPSDKRDLPLRKEVCDPSGKCTCLKLALLGTLKSNATTQDTGPFVDWLNTNSGGSAVVEMITEKPALTPEFLANYDILLVANVNGWSFSDAEKAAVQAWSAESGGGLVALTGFTSESSEPAATSQLMEFAGLSFTTQVAAEGGQGKVPVYYSTDRTTDRARCLTSPQNREAQITTAIHFDPLQGDLQSLTASLDYVGAFIGFGIDPPDDAIVVATDPMSKQPIAVAKEVNQKGRVFAWGDEWVIYKNQWQDPGPPDDPNMNENNACWWPGTAGGGSFLTVQQLYQTKQFWYNVINWVAPPNECFIIDDDEVETVYR